MPQTLAPLRRPKRLATVAGILGLGICQWVSAGSIFTCVDGHGRRITSDRPIAECVDREQRELNPSGSVRRVVPPTLTANERAAAEEKQKALDAQQAQALDERRREKALRVRYPNQAAHDKARADALEQADAVMEAVHNHGKELDQQRSKLDGEMEFYKQDPSKTPAWLIKRIEDNTQQRRKVDAELADKQKEKARINARFDEELTQLRQLWGQPAP